jgi:hypothetical protein
MLHLYQANVLGDFYSTAAITGGVPGADVTNAGGATGIDAYMVQVPYNPSGKNFFLWVSSGATAANTGAKLPTTIATHNYYHLNNITKISGSGGALTDGLAMPPADAAGIDAKLDDGVPDTGTVLADSLGAATGTGDMVLTPGTADCASTMSTYNTNIAATQSGCSLNIQVGF